jgi:hypothetical protein
LRLEGSPRLSKSVRPFSGGAGFLISTVSAIEII